MHSTQQKVILQKNKKQKQKKNQQKKVISLLTHCGPVMPYVWISINIGSGNGLCPDLCQAITWTNADLLSIRSW